MKETESRSYQTTSRNLLLKRAIDLFPRATFMRTKCPVPRTPLAGSSTFAYITAFSSEIKMHLNIRKSVSWQGLQPIDTGTPATLQLLHRPEHCYIDQSLSLLRVSFDQVLFVQEQIDTFLDTEATMSEELFRFADQDPQIGVALLPLCISRRELLAPFSSPTILLRGMTASPSTQWRGWYTASVCRFASLLYASDAESGVFNSA